MNRFICFALSLFMALPHAAAAQELRAVPRSQAEVQLSFSPIVKKTAPAVVNIYSKRKVAVRSRVSPLMDDPFFRQFFGNNMPMRGQARERVVSSLGSGVIVSADGMVVTSYHVVKDADEVKVALADRREFEARIIRTDPGSDLAFLKIDSKEKFPFIEMRDSDSLEVGDIVLALGNPFGVGQTVTQGIISALARSAAGAGDYQFFIQTDAAINPGNSGGALVDLGGKLIGINTAIYSTTGASNGIGFAIPSNMVRSVMAGQEKEGQIVRPWLGIATQPVTSELAESLGLPAPRGVLVRKVTKGSPAEQAGLGSGDVILSINGNEVMSDRELQYRIATSRIGDTVEAQVLQKGVTRGLSITLAAAPQQKVASVKLSGKHPLNGFTVVALTPELVDSLDIPGLTPKGIVVMDAPDGGVLGGALQEGDVILSVGSAEVNSVEALERQLKAGKGSWRIVYRRGGSVLTLDIRL